MYFFAELLKGVYANRNPNSDGNCEGHGHLFTYLPMQHCIQIKKYLNNGNLTINRPIRGNSL